MGNPFLSDDGVGFAVAGKIREGADIDDVSFCELSCGGLRLMEAMIGYDRAIVIDAMVTGSAPGTVQQLEPTSLVTTRNCCSTHDTDFNTAYQTGQLLGLDLPGEVLFYGVEAAECALFSAELSPQVAAALPLAAALIREKILQPGAAI